MFTNNKKYSIIVRHDNDEKTLVICSEGTFYEKLEEKLSLFPAINLRHDDIIDNFKNEKDYEITIGNSVFSANTFNSIDEFIESKAALL